MTGYDKLVRDRIPEIIIGNGGTCRTEIVAGEDLFGYLDRKLDEETEEFRESRDPEELADVMEVLFGLASYLGVTERELMGIRDRKGRNAAGSRKASCSRRAGTDRRTTSEI